MAAGARSLHSSSDDADRRRSSNPPVVDPRIAEFHYHWNKFLRVYLGCPKEATEMEQCNASRGLFDYPEFLKAAKAGRELFDQVKQ